MHNMVLKQYYITMLFIIVYDKYDTLSIKHAMLLCYIAADLCCTPLRL